MIKVKCYECENEFDKSLAEYNRSKKINRPHFCSRSCSTIHRNKNLPSETYQKKCYKIKNHADNRRDEYSPFRAYLGKYRFSNIRHKNELDVEYLKKLWESQNGVCPYTGLKMLLPQTSADKICSPKKASLDRIDSTKEYVKGNVEFVCMAINLAKNKFSKKDTLEFLNEIKAPGNIPGA